MCVNLSNIAVFSIVQLMEMVIVVGGQVCFTICNVMLAYAFICMDIVDLGQVKSLDQIPTGTFAAIGLITFACSTAFLSLFDEAGDAIM
jgi:hypothetical protein